MNLENEKRRALVASLLASGKIGGDSRVRLFPFRVGTAGDDHVVTRRDHGGLIRANDIGVASLRLLKRGHTLDTVRSELGQRYGFAAADVDIAPLLISLAHADFIKQIGDHVISTIPQPFLARTWARIVSAVRTKIVVQAIKSMPLPIMFRLVYKKPRPDPKTLAMMQVLLRSVFPGYADEHIRTLAAGHSETVRNYYLDRLLLGTLSATKLDRWLRDYVRIDGFEHLQRANDEGNGVLICGFHFGSFSLIPFALSRLGCSLTVFTNVPKGEITTIERRLAQLAQEGLPYTFTLVSGVAGLRSLARKVARGETVLMLCDAAEVASQTAQTVPFLGRRLSVNPGIAWFATKTKARIVPCILQRGQTYQHHLEISEAVTPTTAVESVYAILEACVRKDPSQWHRWRDFNSMSSPERVAL